MPFQMPAGAIHVVAAAIRRSDGTTLVAQRPLDKHQGGLWEFPGGKVEPGESPLDALRRELDEEIGVRIGEARPLISLDHDYGDRRVVLEVWQVADWRGEPVGREGQPLQWVSPERLLTLPMPAADAPVVTALRLPDCYLITPEPVDETAWMATLERRIAEGVTLIQLRAKTLAPDSYETLARRVLSMLANDPNIRLLLNAAPEQALALGAHGVHLSVARLRRLDSRPLPADKWVAASCHDATELACAQRAGVDFAVLGPVKQTASHHDGNPIGWEGFRRGVVAAAFPVYGIGGLGKADLTDAWRHGAQGIAAISALWRDVH